MEEQHAQIVAVITKKPETIQGGGAPVFIVSDNAKLQAVSMTIEKAMDAAACELDADTIVIIAR